MNILFLGGDKRYKYLMEKLTKEYKIFQIGFDNLEYAQKLNIQDIDLFQYDVVVFPISGINDKQEIKCENGNLYLPYNLFLKISEKTSFYTGVKTNRLLELIPNKQLTSFLDFEEVKEVNDNLTVERGTRRY